ncbi:MAG: hypothetical protein JWM80_642 [Cyanobacteria bacterium RYN_339]|nr:hypothetical protein [Cyanobacteria bacterium RYN_339]
MTTVNNASGAKGVQPAAPINRGTGPVKGPDTGKLAADEVAIDAAAKPGADPLAKYPVGTRRTPDFSRLDAADQQIAAIGQQVDQQVKAIEAADAKAHGGNVVARGFNRFLNVFKHNDDKLGVAKANALNALTHDMNAALKTYHDEVAAGSPQAEEHLKVAMGEAQQAGQAYDQALGSFAKGNKFWSGIAADVLAGVTVVAGVALTATGLGAPIGVPLMAAGAFLAGGAVTLGAHGLLDNQFDLKKEGIQTFAVGGVGGIAAALTGGASEAFTAGITGTAARVVGQEAIQGAGARFMIGAAANSVVGAGFGGATSGVQAIAAGEDAAGVLKATALGAAGGAVGGVAAHGLGAVIGKGAQVAQRSLATEDGLLARSVNTVMNASESRVGQAVGVVAKGTVTGAGAGGAGAMLNQLASGQPIDWDAVRDQILAGGIQGGALAGAGLAGKALPQRSPVKAPPSIQEANETLSKLAPKNPALAAEHAKLVERYKSAQETAVRRMTNMRVYENTIAAETDPVKRAALLQEHAGLFGDAMNNLDFARENLVAFARKNLGPASVRQVIATVGEPNPDVQYAKRNPENLDASTIKRNEALMAFLTQFPNLKLPVNVAEPGVQGLSPRALQAVSEALNSNASSADAKGAANVEHLASVLKGVLETAAKQKGAPLTQAEVDTRAAVTVLTDAWMKGATPAQLEQVRTAATNAGGSGGEIWDQLMRRGLGLKGTEQIPTSIKGDIKGWLESMSTPKDRATLREHFQASGLSEKEAATWADRVINRDQTITNPFLIGTWTHGVPAFGAIEHVVKSMGGDQAMAQAYYEEVLAHHASGFVMDGFSRGGLNVDFFKMAREGALTPEAAQRLTNLYSTATELSGKWRPVIDQVASGKPLNLAQYEAFRAKVGLKPLAPAERAAFGQLNNGTGRPVNQQELEAFRRAYSAEARPYRDAIGGLTENSRSQLLNDDRQQFTQVGMPKWITMMFGMTKPATMGALIDNVYKGPVQGYAEENYARGDQAGQAFDAVTAPIGERLGMTFDPKTRTYHAANPTEGALNEFARRITADPALNKQLTVDLVNPRDPQAVVEWLRGQKPDPSVLNRLVAAPAAPEPTVARPVAPPDPATQKYIGELQAAARNASSQARTLNDAAGTAAGDGLWDRGIVLANHGDTMTAAAELYRQALGIASKGTPEARQEATKLISDGMQRLGNLENAQYAAGQLNK